MLKLECSKLPINSVQKGVYISLHFGPSLMFLSFCQCEASSEACVCFKPENKAIVYSKVTNLFVGHQLSLSSILLIPYYFCIVVEQIATCLVAVNKTLFLFLLFSFSWVRSRCNMLDPQLTVSQSCSIEGGFQDQFSASSSHNHWQNVLFLCWLTEGSGF